MKMDSLKLHDVRVEKANAIAKYRRSQRLAIFFRFMEVLVFLIVLSKSSTQFASSLKISSEYFRGVSLSLVSSRSVFFVGNAIVVVLFLISGHFSGDRGDRTADFYDEYVEKCRSNQHKWSESMAPESDSYQGKVISRTRSANFERERRRDFRRSMSEKCRKADGYPEDEMSGEEFRRTVEAFIARQQKSLRQEEEISDVVSA